MMVTLTVSFIITKTIISGRLLILKLVARCRKMAADVANSSQKLKALAEFKATAKYKEYCSQFEKAWKFAEFGFCLRDAET